MAMRLPTAEYLRYKGAVELVCELNPSGSRFNELVTELPISRPTVDNRLLEAQAAALLDVELELGKRGKPKIYTFTSYGASVRLWLDDMGVTAEYRNYKTALQRFEEKQEMVRKSFETGTPDLPSDSEGRGTRGILLERYSTDEE
jgi:DNA-binding HxlR family transcriptional regulator